MVQGQKPEARAGIPCHVASVDWKRFCHCPERHQPGVDRRILCCIRSCSASLYVLPDSENGARQKINEGPFQQSPDHVGWLALFRNHYSCGGERNSTDDCHSYGRRLNHSATKGKCSMPF